MVRPLILLAFLSYLTVSITGCGGANSSSGPQYSVPSDFAAYISQFEQLSQQANNPIVISDLVVQFGNLPSGTEFGECDITDGSTPVITIDQTIWNAIDDNARMALMLHELGHCVLRRMHLNTYGGDGYPTSIMNANPIDGPTYLSHAAEYDAELFRIQNQF